MFRLSQACPTRPSSRAASSTSAIASVRYDSGRLGFGWAAGFNSSRRGRLGRIGLASSRRYMRETCRQSESWRSCHRGMPCSSSPPPRGSTFPAFELRESQSDQADRRLRIEVGSSTCTGCSQGHHLEQPAAQLPWCLPDIRITFPPSAHSPPVQQTGTGRRQTSSRARVHPRLLSVDRDSPASSPRPTPTCRPSSACSRPLQLARLHAASRLLLLGNPPRHLDSLSRPCQRARRPSSQAGRAPQINVDALPPFSTTTYR